MDKTRKINFSPLGYRNSITPISVCFLGGKNPSLINCFGFFIFLRVSYSHISKEISYISFTPLFLIWNIFTLHSVNSLSWKYCLFHVWNRINCEISIYKFFRFPDTLLRSQMVEIWRWVCLAGMWKSTQHSVLWIWFDMEIKYHWKQTKSFNFLRLHEFRYIG